MQLRTLQILTSYHSFQVPSLNFSNPLQVTVSILITTPAATQASVSMYLISNMTLLQETLPMLLGDLNHNTE